MGLFGYDSPVTKALTTLANYIALNICFLVCCIPVFTIGASISALCAVFQKSQDSHSVTSRFFKAFKANFNQAAKAWIVFLVVGILLGLEVYIFFFSSLVIPASGVIRILICFLVFLYFGAIGYTFPLIARYDNSVPNTLVNACVFTVVLAPVTLFMILFSILPAVCLLLSPSLFVVVFISWIFIGFSLTWRMNCFLIDKLLSKRLSTKSKPTVLS